MWTLRKSQEKCKWHKQIRNNDCHWDFILIRYKKCLKYILTKHGLGWHCSGIEILQGVMGQKRLRFFLASIRFDDTFTRRSRETIDKLLAILESYYSFNHNCNKFYSPEDQLTVHKKLEPFRGRCTFIQYTHKNPGKYSLNIFAVDSRTFYCFKLETYCSTQTSGEGRVVLNRTWSFECGHRYRQ